MRSTGKSKFGKFQLFDSISAPKKEKKKRFNEGVRPCGKGLFITIYK